MANSDLGCFVLLLDVKRVLLADAFAQTLVERDANATTLQIEVARVKAFRVPFLSMGFGISLSSGQAMRSEPLKQSFHPIFLS